MISVEGCTAHSVDEAFVKTVRYFRDAPGGYSYYRITEDDTSPDKNKTMQELPILLHITNPRNRLVYSKDIDIYNMVGLWIYLMSGSESVGPISFYNSIARRFVDEGTNPTRLRGTWGARLFGTGAVDRVIALLRVSPNTRRAIIPVLHPEDVGYQSRNLPCLATIQFAVQAGKLNCYATMRSQALIGVMPYDLFLLTMLHEYVAMRAGLSLGEYFHFAPLCGIRETEKPIVDEILSEKKDIVYARIPMPEMPLLEGGQLALFHYCERKVRQGKDLLPDEVELLPEYWGGFLDITHAKAIGDPSLILNAHKTFPDNFLDKSVVTIRKRENRV